MNTLVLEAMPKRVWAIHRRGVAQLADAVAPGDYDPAVLDDGYREPGHPEGLEDLGDVGVEPGRGRDVLGEGRVGDGEDSRRDADGGTAHHHFPSRMTPRQTSPTPSQPRRVACSPRNITAKRATSATLSLSTAATREASPALSARK